MCCREAGEKEKESVHQALLFFDFAIFIGQDTITQREAPRRKRV